jgi:hypothetical protein
MKGSKNRLVDYSMRILSILSKGDTNVNQIIKQTSSDRTYVIGVIKNLLREKIIEESNDMTNRKHKQAKPKRLTYLGQELADLIKKVSDYNRSYSDLKRLRVDTFNFRKNNSPKVLEGKLRSEGWSTQDIEFYNSYAEGIRLLEFECSLPLNDLLLFRSAGILHQFQTNNIVKKILNKIIMDAISRHVDSVVYSLNSEGWLPIIGDNHVPLIMALPAKISDYHVYNNRFTRNHVKGIITALFSLLHPHKSDFRRNVNKLKSDIEDLEVRVRDVKTERESKGSYLSSILENKKEALTFYDELMNRF